MALIRWMLIAMMISILTVRRSTTTLIPMMPTIPGPFEVAELAHRYSFNEGAELLDSIGGNDGVLVGDAVVLDRTASARWRAQRPDCRQHGVHEPC